MRRSLSCSPNRFSIFEKVRPRTCSQFESTMENVEREKEEATASFDRFRAVVNWRQISELLLVLALISWTTGRFPAVTAAACIVDFSDYLLNHHVVFLIGNAIIVLLFMICRQSDATVSGGEFYDDYVKFSAAAAADHQREPVEPGDGREATFCAPVTEVNVGNGEKQLVVHADEQSERSISQSDDVSAAIEKAKRQIRKFERTQSENLKREISVRTPPVFRRSETDNNRRTVRSRAAEMETLSNEEFRRKVDAFIDAHWSGRRKRAKRIEFRELENYNPLLKIA